MPLRWAKPSTNQRAAEPKPAARWFVKGFAQEALCFLELDSQLVGRTGEVFPALDRGLGIGRIGEMRGIVDPGALLLGVNFALQIDRHALEVGDHPFNLGDPSALLINLKFLQADQRFT